jgi:hypothetical protein
MGLGGKMDNGRGAKIADRLRYECRITDVGMHERVTLIGGRAGKRLQIAGVGELVKIDDPNGWFFRQDLANEAASDEAGAPGYQNRWREIARV